VLLGGGVNLARDPRNGRNFEYVGEDPLLAGTLAGGAIRGTQDQHVISTTKHFALNANETNRYTLDARIDRAAFEIAIERGHPGAVMCAYNGVNGAHACGNDWLLDRVLKRECGFPGWVMSDGGAVHGPEDARQGLDQESGEQLDTSVWFDAALQEAVARHQAPPARIDDMVRRILRSMFAVGIAENPPVRADVAGSAVRPGPGRGGCDRSAGAPIDRGVSTANAATHTVTSRLKAVSFRITQAQTSAADVESLAERLGVRLATQAFSPMSVAQTLASTLTITLSNSNKFDLTQTQFSDTLPSGLTVASSPAPSTTCGATGSSLTIASNTLTLTGADVPPLQSCTITVAVTGAAAGNYLNTIAPNAVTSGPAGGNPAASTAALIVTAPYPPTVTEAFSPANTTPNGVSNLAITLSNANGFAKTGTGLTDTMPAGLIIQASPPPASSCGGTLTTTSTSAALAGATLPANATCTITFTVTGATPGSYTNTIAANAVTIPTGGNAAAASATLAVTATQSSGTGGGNGGGASSSAHRGGGSAHWPELLFLAAVVLATHRRVHFR
jgi:uncharacterized repeat protein (TIGR01451 family)